MYAEQGTLRGIHKRVLCDSESGQGGCRNRSDRFSPGAELTATGTNGDTTGSSSSGSVRVSIIHPGRRFIIIIRISQGFHYPSGSQVHHHHPDQSGFPLSIRVAGSSSSSGPVRVSIIHPGRRFIIIIRTSHGFHYPPAEHFHHHHPDSLSFPQCSLSYCGFKPWG